MTAANGNGSRRAEAGGLAHVAAAERLARAIVIAFGACELVDMPLSDVQKISIIEAALVEFDGFAAHVSSLEWVATLIGDARHG